MQFRSPLFQFPFIIESAIMLMPTKLIYFTHVSPSSSFSGAVSLTIKNQQHGSFIIGIYILTITKITFGSESNSSLFTTPVCPIYYFPNFTFSLSKYALSIHSSENPQEKQTYLSTRTADKFVQPTWMLFPIPYAPELPGISKISLLPHLVHTLLFFMFLSPFKLLAIHHFFFLQKVKLTGVNSSILISLPLPSGLPAHNPTSVSPDFAAYGTYCSTFIGTYSYSTFAISITLSSGIT